MHEYSGFPTGLSCERHDPDPSVDVSGWEDMNDLKTSSTVIKDLDRPIDITRHVISPFQQHNLDYQDCRFYCIAHLMCYRYAIVNGQKIFATGIQKWSRHLTDFPTPKLCTAVALYTGRHLQLCLTDTAIKSVLIDTGPRPFTLKCLSPWGYEPADPDNCPRTDLVSDVLINVCVLAGGDRLTPCRWLEMPHESRPGTRRARRSLAERILAQS